MRSVSGSGARPLAATVAAPLRTGLGRVVEVWRRWRARRARIRELEQLARLDDTLLRDVGLTRHDVLVAIDEAHRARRRPDVSPRRRPR